MLWDGNQQIQEYTDEQIFTTVYEQGSFEPVARVVQLSEVLEKQRIAEKILYIQQHVPSGVINQDFYDRIEQAKTPLLKIYHYHCNHLGTPQELTNQDGDVIWLSYDRAWGGSFETIYKPQFIDNYALQESELQPIKFQGQSLDVETGLHYNRFRYYDSDVGMFISRDPIGLLGGNNVFQYAPNPIGWIDPFGLACLTYNHKLKPNKKTNKTELRRQIRGQISAMNKIIQEEGMIGLKNRIRNYSTSLEKEGRAYTASLGSAGKNKAWLHEPDMRVGGLPTDVYKTGDKRVNSILGGQAKERAEDILAMPDDTTKITYRLKVN